jgi:hypothetical protein
MVMRKPVILHQKNDISLFQYTMEDIGPQKISKVLASQPRKPIFLLESKENDIE